MAYCTKCGKELQEDFKVCPNCGATVGEETPVYSGGTVETSTPEQDKGGFLWGLLGCCIPLVGLIMFLVWKDTKPKSAKALGIGAIVGVVVVVVFYIVVFAAGIGLTMLGLEGMY